MGWLRTRRTSSCLNRYDTEPLGSPHFPEAPSGAFCVSIGSALLALILLALLTAPVALHAQASGAVFLPDTVLRAAGMPRVLILRANPGGVAALRLSVPLLERPAEAGVGRMLAARSERRMEGAAREIGARVSAQRTPWGLTYSVEGAGADMEHLVYLLRLAVEEPAPDFSELDRLRAELLSDLDRRAESPGDRLLTDLRRAAAPDLPSLAGSHVSVRRLDASLMRAVWRRSHRASSMSLVAMTSVDPTVLLAMLQALGLPARDVAPPFDAADPSGPPTGPPPLRNWYGEARVDPALGDPHAAVAALLMSQQVADPGPGVEVGVRLWELRDRTLLVVAGAARGRRATATLRAVVQAAVPDFLLALDPLRVREAVARVELVYRTRASTPGGLVEAVGRGVDGTGRASGASDYLVALARVTAASLTDYLNRLGAPVVVEIVP